MQAEFQPSLFESFIYILARLRFPGPLVPDHHRPATILAFGNRALKTSVFHGVVFHFDGKALVSGVVTGAFGNGPAFEYAAPSQAKVVVQARGRVFLDNKRQLSRIDL